MTIREKVINELIKCPGQRKRQLASSIQVPVKEIISLLFEMCNEGILRREDYRDPAQMEFYEKYFVVNQK